MVSIITLLVSRFSALAKVMKQLHTALASGAARPIYNTQKAGQGAAYQTTQRDTDLRQVFTFDPSIQFLNFSL